MQCANCHFENMPGVDECGRCGGSLHVASAAIDVHPPRAGRWAKRWRRATPWLSRPWFHIRWPDLPRIDRTGWTDTFPDAPALPVLLRMLVPGWPQKYLGRVRRGRIFFWSYLAAILLGLVSVGSPLGGGLLGVALSLHAASILDVVVNAQGASLRSIVVNSAACLLVLTGGLYWPAGWLISRVAVPQRILISTPPFAAGDVILYNPSAFRNATPEVGDVVICNLPPRRIPAPGRYYGYNAMLEVGGLRIERLLAGPGSKVQWAAGELTVDDRPAEWLPLTLDAMPDFSLVVPANSYLMVPSPIAFEDFGYVAYNTPGLAFRQPAIVTRTAILGRVFFRNQPLWRMGRIR
jgi:hypothetical protein